MSSDSNPDAVKLLSDDALREIEARANAATEGVWEWTYHPDRHDSVIALESMAKEVDVLLCTGDSNGGAWGDISEANAEFMAHAREDIPALCATVRALKEANKALAKDVVTATNQAHKFSELADKRHDELWEARRQRDSLAANMDAYIAESNTALRDQLAQRDQLLSDSTETEDRCRDLLAAYDKSSAEGIVPLDEVVRLVVGQLAQARQERDAALESLHDLTEAIARDNQRKRIQ